jgi:O-antigen ligase
MFKIKQKYLDHLSGFALALLIAFPMLRVTVLPLPSVALILPIIILGTSGMLSLYRDGTKLLKWDVVTYLYLICVLFLYLLVSALWNTYDVNIRENVLRILFIVLLSVCVAISFNRNSIDYFFKWMVIFAIFTTFTYIYHYMTIGNIRGYGIPAYLTRSLVLGLGAVVSVSKLLFYETTNKKFYLLITFFLFFGLAISLGRAALLAAAVIALVLIAYYYRNNWPKSYSLTEYFRNKSSLIFVFSVLGIIAFAVTRIERTFNRFMRLFTGAEFSTHRVDLWKNAVTGFFDAPVFGYGLSNSGAVINFNYPHNLFLEVMLDGGLVAFLLLFIIAFYPLVKAYLLFNEGSFKTPLWIPLISCYVFLLMNFSLATSFYEGRALIAIGLIIVIFLSSIKSDIKSANTLKPIP